MKSLLPDKVFLHSYQLKNDNLAYGIISMDENCSFNKGYFNLNTDVGNLSPITISCMGYKSKTITVETIKISNFVICLNKKSSGEYTSSGCVGS